MLSIADRQRQQNLWIRNDLRFRYDRSMTGNPKRSIARLADWHRLRRQLLKPEADPVAVQRALDQAVKRIDVPVLWLLGTAQSGKTSIVRALTGSSRAEIGNGFQPCTRTAALYDFPPAAPVVRFLDTRGLGEVGYDPGEDLAECEARAHQLIAVLKVNETRPGGVFEALHEIRRRHPDWPLIITQTCLHEAYPTPEQPHVLPYPFEQADWRHRIPNELARLIQAQRSAFERLPGHAPVAWVPIDFTLPEDSFEPVDYGLEALWRALEDSAVAGLRARLMADPGVRNAYDRAAHPQIVGHSIAAAALGTVPLVDLAALPALQARLLQVLAGIYGLHWNRRSITEFSSLLGAGIAVGLGVRLAGRSLAKLIPGWGQTAGAVWAAGANGTTTYALGKAACVYLHRRRKGETIDAESLRRTFREALGQGRRLLDRQDNT